MNDDEKQVKHISGQKEEADAYMVRKRSVLPVIYNSNLARYDWHAQEPPEESCNQIVHVKLEREVDSLQQEVQRLQGQIGINDLDPIVLEDLQMAVLDDEEDEVYDFSWAPDVPNPIKEEPLQNADDSFDFVYDQPSDNEEEQNVSVPNMNVSAASTTNTHGQENDNQAASLTTVQAATSTSTVNSIFDKVAGFINVTTNVCFLDLFSCFFLHHYISIALSQDIFDHYFPSVDVSIGNAIWNLLVFYNERQEEKGGGELFDLKFVELLLKGILGYEVMAEMDVEPDFSDPKLILAKGNFSNNRTKKQYKKTIA